MDVRCPQCGTDYVFDERRIGPRGVSVKCTACSHVFRVYRPSTADRPWLIRHPDGQQIQFQELTVLQKWIVEGRIAREDQISRSGETWRSLGDIAELEPFFRVYEQAEELRRLREPQGKAHRPMPATDVVRAMEPIDASALESDELGTLPEGEVPTRRSVPPRPVTLNQRRHQRSTDLIVEPAPGYESAPDLADEDEPETQPASQLPGAAFASRTLDFPDGGPDRRERSPERGHRGLWVAVVVIVAGLLAAGAFFAFVGPDEARELLRSIGASSPSAGDGPPSEPALAPLSAGERTSAEAPEPSPGSESSPQHTVPRTPEGGSLAPDPGAPEKGSMAPNEGAAATGAGPAGLRRSGPDEAASLVEEADRLLRSGRQVAALDAYGRASELAPEDVRTQVGKGLCYLAMDRPRLALTAFERARAVDSEHPDVYFGLGEARLRLGDGAAAQSAFLKYLATSPPLGPRRETAELRLESLR